MYKYKLSNGKIFNVAKNDVQDFLSAHRDATLVSEPKQQSEVEVIEVEEDKEEKEEKYPWGAPKNRTVQMLAPIKKLGIKGAEEAAVDPLSIHKNEYRKNITSAETAKDMSGLYYSPKLGFMDEATLEMFFAESEFSVDKSDPKYSAIKDIWMY